jgi:chromosome segregation ATPase
MSHEFSLEERISQIDDKLNCLLQMYRDPQCRGKEELLKRENDYLHQSLEISDRQKTLLQEQLTQYQHNLDTLEMQQQELQTELAQVRQMLIQQQTQIEMLRQALTQSQEYAQKLELELAQVQKSQRQTEPPDPPRPQGILADSLAEKLGLSTAELFQQWRAGKLQGWHLGRDQRFYPAR